MKILHVTYSLLNGGKENMLVDIANEQQKLGHRVHIIIINEFVDQAIRNRILKGIPVYELKRKRGSRNPVPFIKMVYKINWSIRPVIIHMHDHFLGNFVSFIKAKRVVSTIHGKEPDVNPLKKFDCVYSISGSVKNHILEKGGPESTVIYNGIKTDKVVKKGTWKPTENLKIIMISRLNHDRKGQDILIKALNRIVNHFQIQNIHVDIIGEGPSRNYLESLIRKMNLDSYVFLLGNVDRDEVYKRLHQYDLFIQPSRIEGFGLTITEAMAAKVPVISSNVEGPSEILDAGKYGLLFDSENEAQLADRIIQTKEMYKDGSIKELVERAYQRCIDEFDIKKTAQNYCDHYLQ